MIPSSRLRIGLPNLLLLAFLLTRSVPAKLPSTTRPAVALTIGVGILGNPGGGSRRPASVVVAATDTMIRYGDFDGVWCAVNYGGAESARPSALGRLAKLS